MRTKGELLEEPGQGRWMRTRALAASRARRTAQPTCAARHPAAQPHRWRCAAAAPWNAPAARLAAAQGARAWCAGSPRPAQSDAPPPAPQAAPVAVRCAAGNNPHHHATAPMTATTAFTPLDERLLAHADPSRRHVGKQENCNDGVLGQSLKLERQAGAACAQRRSPAHVGRLGAAQDLPAREHVALRSYDHALQYHMQRAQRRRRVPHRGHLSGHLSAARLHHVLQQHHPKQAPLPHMQSGRRCHAWGSALACDRRLPWDPPSQETIADLSCL